MRPQAGKLRITVYFDLKEVIVSNPWTKKNPFMSMWLSTAHKMMGSARSQASAAAKREIALTQAQAARQVVDFWSGKAAAPAPRTKRKRKR